MLKTYKPLRSKSVLKRGKGLDRSAPLRASSKSKRARTVIDLWNRLSRHVRQSPCLKCGCKADHTHHVLTRAAYPELGLCWRNLIPLCAVCHTFAHTSPATFRYWLETIKPGLYDYLRSLARTMLAKRDLDTVGREVDDFVKRPWREHFDAMEVA